MKKILVPTDFSKHATNALKVAVQIAKEHDAEIVLLHMLELPQQTSDALDRGSEIPEIMLYKKMAVQRIDDLTKSDLLSDVKASNIVQFERAFEGILAISKENDIDLVVMGSHGASGFKEMFIGSNTEKVVRSSEVPVLVIKNETDHFKTKNMIFASDFTDEVNEPFKKVLKFADMLDAELKLVMINTPNSFKTTAVAEKMMTDFADRFEMSHLKKFIYNDANIEKGILNFAHTVNADLIAICTHGRTGMARLLNGSISEDLVNRTSIPMVTFKI
ncbi:universal stress protein [Flavobacterium ardleyense]|uniref:universal stress protein n=1 Tax=Flavobacterium ardleyense TaxID=2038737 RepID=UPI00298C843F|nr:universal stress protein [Flavobacterium ardleyense]